MNEDPLHHAPPRPPSTDTAGPSDHAGALWPWEGYDTQVLRLKRHVGQPVFLTEITATEMHLAATLHGRAVLLLDVIDFPRPDPAAGLYPHMIITGDGRGLNLGRIARICLNHPFGPDAQDLLYQEERLSQEWLYRARRLTPERIAHTARALLKPLLPSPGGGPRLTATPPPAPLNPGDDAGHAAP